MQDRACADHGEDGQQNADERSQIVGVGDVLPHTVIVACAERLRHRNGKSRADAGGKSHHQKADGACCTNASQRTGTQIAPDDDGVHHAVELL